MIQIYINKFHNKKRNSEVDVEIVYKVKMVIWGHYKERNDQYVK